jgi:galactokinase
MLCQRVENEFVGARVGIMDQFVACHASPRAALLLDCRSLESRTVPVPSGVRLVACNTMVRHGHATGEYNRRRAECERGIAILRARRPDVASLRDVDPSTLEAHRTELPDEIFRRCRHVVTENGRVLRMATALEQNDLAAIAALMAASHRSLRDDYAVSCPELDAMVEAAAMPGVHGARMTGGGFGGCTVNLVDTEAVDDFMRQVPRKYEASTGRRPEIYVSDAGGGAARVR